MDAVDHAAGEEGGVEARAGFGEQGEDAFLAEFVEDGADGDAALLRLGELLRGRRGCGVRAMRASSLETVKTTTSF